MTRVNRQLKAEKAAQHQRVPKTGGRAKLAPEPVTAPPELISTADEGMTSLKEAIDDLRKRIEVLESTCRSRVEDNGNASAKLGLPAEEARVTCLSCQNNFPWVNVFSICQDCAADLKTSAVNELIEAYFGS